MSENNGLSPSKNLLARDTCAGRRLRQSLLLRRCLYTGRIRREPQCKEGASQIGITLASQPPRDTGHTSCNQEEPPACFHDRFSTNPKLCKLPPWIYYTQKDCQRDFSLRASMMAFPPLLSSANSLSGSTSPDSKMMPKGLLPARFHDGFSTTPKLCKLPQWIYLTRLKNDAKGTSPCALP